MRGREKKKKDERKIRKSRPRCFTKIIKPDQTSGTRTVTRNSPSPVAGGIRARCVKERDYSTSRIPRASKVLPSVKGNAPEERGAEIRGGLSGDPGKSGRDSFPTSTGDTGYLGPKDEVGFPLVIRRSRSFKMLRGNADGEGWKEVIWRDLPTGKGERPSSHTPEPEDEI